MPISKVYNDVFIAPPRLDARSRLDFRRDALEHLERVARQNVTFVAIDLSRTTDIDASGLGVLVLVQKRAREQLLATKLLNAPPPVKKIIALTKLEHLFEFED
jgi:anti-anti-sigma factor